MRIFFAAALTAFLALPAWAQTADRQGTASTVGPHDQTGHNKDARTPGHKPDKHKRQATVKPEASGGNDVSATGAGTGSTPTGAHGTGTTGSGPISGNNGKVGKQGDGASGNTVKPQR